MIHKLICDSKDRLGVNGVAEIKIHPFFKGIDWKTIESIDNPFKPEIKDKFDFGNFDEFEEK